MNDGGQAFPGKTVEKFHHAFGGGVTERELYQPGMSLRDYFAVKALLGIYSSCPAEVRVALFQNKLFQDWAEFAYEQADAMLKARESTKSINSGE